MPQREPNVAMGNDEDKRRQLLQLRALFRETGALHEAQAIQLKLWPFTIDPRIDEDGVKAHVYPQRKLVEYQWAAAGVKSTWRPDGAYLARLARLPGWVKFLLGDDFGVSVALNGRNLSLRARKPRSGGRRGPKRRAKR